MVKLFLSEEDATAMIDSSESAKLLVVLLNQLETTLWSAVVSSGCRSEARLWLCNTVSQLKSISPRNHADLFVTWVRSKPTKWRLASQILQMIFEKRPYIAGPLIAKRSHILQRFFRGHPRRISEWFSSFDTSGGSDHKRGAKALSQFAFLNREFCWEELEWKGKHGQSPAVVATKPHYFLDLDIQRTIDNFLEYVPEFWSSNEFAESLKDGEIFSIDRQYFLDMFVDLMFKEDGSRDIWEAIDVFLMREPFSSLCQRLLIGLEESDFCVFLKLLSKYLRPEKEDGNNSNFWLEIFLSQYGDFDQLLVMNAVINQGRHLLRLMNDDECKEEKEKMRDIVSQISKANTYLTLLKECRLSMRTVEAARLLGLKSWVVHYRLSEECQSLDSWENLFISNGITFRRSGKYSMLQSGLLEKSGNKLESIGFKPNKRKEKKRKRRRRNFDYEDDDDDDLLDNDIVNEDQEGLQCSTVGSWLLSTDGFASSWTNADLPEHLARHCFFVWMKWVLILRDHRD